MFLNFLKVLFILIVTALFLFKFARFDLVKETFINYFSSLKKLNKEIFSNPNFNIDSLQPKLNAISQNGIKLLVRILFFLAPYLLSVIILNYSIKSVPFGLIILLPSLSYLSLLKKI